MSVIIPSPTYPPRTYDGRRLGLQFTPVSPTLPTISPPEPSPPAMIEDDENLFDRSIRENIAYGAAMWSGYRACRACSHVHDFVLGLLQRYVTSVGENRSLLSGGQGQAQRIPIAQEDIDGACEWGSDIIFVSSSSWSSAYLFFHFDPNNTFRCFLVFDYHVVPTVDCSGVYYQFTLTTATSAKFAKMSLPPALINKKYRLKDTLGSGSSGMTPFPSPVLR